MIRDIQPEISDDLKKFLFKYFKDDKKIHISKTISDEDFQIFVEFYRSGLIIFKCVRCKRQKKLDFKNHGATVFLTKIGEFELDLYKKDLESFARIKADAKKRDLQTQI